MSRIIIASEIGYRETGVSPNVTGTLYTASEGFVTGSSDTLANTYFAGRLDGDVRYRIRLSTAFWGGESSIGIGSLEVINDDGDLDAWIDYEFRDHPVVLKKHISGTSYNDATVLLNAIIERMDVISEKRLRFVIRDPSAELVKPLTTAVYDNTTDAEGVLKPIPFGKPELVRPVLIDGSTLEYHVSDTALQNIVTVYDQGVSVDFIPVTYGFKLASAPDGKVTATILTSGSGNDPQLTVSETEYLTSGGGHSLQMFDDSLSPEVSLDYAFSDAPHTRASSDGGKFYFEMFMDNIEYQSGPAVGEGSFLTGGTSNGSLAIGIQSSSISNPQNVKTSGLYCMAVGNSSVSDQQTVWHHAYINNSMPDEWWTTSSSYYPNGHTIGVKVDFDSSPMTVTFLHNNVQPDAVFGPWGITAAAYSPVIGVSSSGKADLLNVATIRVIEDDFVYAIPSGYAAWSEGITPDASFTKLVDSITDRTTGVSFDAASVTAINELVHSSPATAYTYAYYLDQSTTAAKLLSWSMSGIGGFWFINRLGNVQVGQLKAPGTSAKTIDDVQITGSISLALDNARGLSNGAGAKKNWSQYPDGSAAGSVTEIFKQQITRGYQFEYRTSTSMAAAYDHANGAKLPISLLSDAAATQIETDRLAALYATERNFYRVPIALNSENFDSVIDDIGNTYTIKSDRFGLSAGVDMVLVGVEGAFLSNELVMTLWGGTGGVSSAGSAVGTFNEQIEALSPKRLYYFQDANFNAGASDSGSDGIAFPINSAPAPSIAIRATQNQSAVTSGSYFIEGTGAGTIQEDYLTSTTSFTVTVGFDHFGGEDEWFGVFHARASSSSQLFSFGSRWNSGSTPHTGAAFEGRNADGSGFGVGGGAAYDVVAAGGNIVTVRRNGTVLSMFVNGEVKLTLTGTETAMSSYTGHGFTCGDSFTAAQTGKCKYDVCAIFNSSLSDAEIEAYHAAWMAEL